MTQFRVRAMTLAILLLAVLGAAAAQAPEWEYGILRHAPTELSWRSPEHVVGPFRDEDRLADAIRSVHGLPIGGEAGVVYVLNVLGQFGWELVAHYQNDFVFKRPVLAAP